MCPLCLAASGLYVAGGLSAGAVTTFLAAKVLRKLELARRRQELPWVRIDKEYRFETDEGSASLADLFRGRSQLLVYHFMFGPDYTAGCATCSTIADGFNGFGVHLANHDVTLSAVSRAPLAKLQAYKQRMGWTFPWASSSGSDFNRDFSVSFTEQQQREGGIEYNYQREPPWTASGIGDALTKRGEDPVAENAAMTGTDVATYTRERPGMSAFVLEDGVVYHTYSTYARGLDDASGACIRGSTARHAGATRLGSGGAATTSTPTKARARADEPDAAMEYVLQGLDGRCLSPSVPTPPPPTMRCRPRPNALLLKALQLPLPACCSPDTAGGCRSAVPRRACARSRFRVSARSHQGNRGMP